MGVVKVLYKGKEIPLEDVTVIWTDCFGELQHPGTIEDYAGGHHPLCLCSIHAVLHG